MSVRARIVRRCALFFFTIALPMVGIESADAQPLGTFRWQQQPYCNVITLSITQLAGTFQLDGFDDQCGAATRAAVVGIAFLNPNGSVGIGLTIVTTPGATPVHVDATVDLSTISGTWRDSSGATGPWTFTASAGAGSPRPASRAAFPAGLSLSGSTMTNVGSPVDANDAATKAYVDAGLAAALASANTGIAATQAAITTGIADTRAYARTLATPPLNLSAYTATLSSGAMTSTTGGCLELGTGGALMRLELPVPIGATITEVRLKTVNNSVTPLFLRFHAVDFVAGVGVSDNFQVASSAAPNEGTQFLAIVDTPRAPVSETRAYYVVADAVAHTGSQQFCGAQVFYSMP